MGQRIINAIEIATSKKISITYEVFILMVDDNIVFLIGTLIPTAVAAIGLVNVLKTYREGQLLKRKDIIIPLIDQFDNSDDLFLAKAILDDFTCNIPRAETKNEDLKRFHEISKADLAFYNRSNLKKFLRYHRAEGAEPVTSLEEKAVRRSFDSMIFFFFKLQYLYRTGLLKDKELYYFKFYMTAAFKDKDYGDYGLWNYIKNYQLPLEQNFVRKVTELSDTIFDKNRLF
jgi:hypothetical protein